MGREEMGKKGEERGTGRGKRGKEEGGREVMEREMRGGNVSPCMGKKPTKPAILKTKI